MSRSRSAIALLRARRRPCNSCRLASKNALLVRRPPSLGRSAACFSSAKATVAARQRHRPSMAVPAASAVCWAALQPQLSLEAEHGRACCYRGTHLTGTRTHHVAPTNSASAEQQRSSSPDEVVRHARVVPQVGQRGAVEEVHPHAAVQRGDFCARSKKARWIHQVTTWIGCHARTRGVAPHECA